MSDLIISRKQFIKLRTSQVRLKYSLMADAEIARSLPDWQAEFDSLAEEQVPEVLDLRSELRRLSAGV